MFCTTVIPTVGRPELARAVQSVLDQTCTTGDFEVIVVNDSGRPLAYADWQESDRVTVIDTNQRERSFARNTGASIAKGEYLHFLDDDDWLLPNAFQELSSLACAQTDAVWLCGGTQLVDRDGNSLIHLRLEFSGNYSVQAMAGEIIHLQASLIKAKPFFAIGGFNNVLIGPEDNDLLRRMTLNGDVLSSPKTIVCKAMGSEGSTTDLLNHAKRSRWARELILNEPGVLQRMHRSAYSSYWHGKVVRAYLTSTLWNLQHGRIFTAASRSAYALVGLILGGRHVFSPKFFHAVFRAHQGETFLKGIQEAGQHDSINNQASSLPRKIL